MLSEMRWERGGPACSVTATNSSGAALEFAPLHEALSAHRKVPPENASEPSRFKLLRALPSVFLQALDAGVSSLLATSPEVFSRSVSPFSV